MVLAGPLSLTRRKGRSVFGPWQAVLPSAWFGVEPGARKRHGRSEESYPRMPDLVKTMIEGGASGRAVPSRKTDSGTGDQREGLARV